MRERDFFLLNIFFKKRINPKRICFRPLDKGGKKVFSEIKDLRSSWPSCRIFPCLSEVVESEPGTADLSECVERPQKYAEVKWLDLAPRERWLDLSASQTDRRSPRRRRQREEHGNEENPHRRRGRRRRRWWWWWWWWELVLVLCVSERIWTPREENDGRWLLHGEGCPPPLPLPWWSRWAVRWWRERSAGERSSAVGLERERAFVVLGSTGWTFCHPSRRFWSPFELFLVQGKSTESTGKVQVNQRYFSKHGVSRYTCQLFVDCYYTLSVEKVTVLRA